MAFSDRTESSVAGVLARSFGSRGRNWYTNIVIPEFQRPYCWSVADIRKLLNDVDALRFRNYKDGYFGENGGIDPYYFGTVCFRTYVVRQRDKKEYLLELFDGQQRIISFLILTALLYRSAAEHEDGEIRGFAGYVDWLLGTDWRDILIVKQPQTVRHIRDVYRELDREYEVCRRESAVLSGGEEGEDDFYTRTLRRDCLRMKFILRHCVFAVKILETPREASQFFQAENNRGLTMSLLDILKAHHMRFTTDENSQVRMQTIWSTFNVQEETREGDDAGMAEAAERNRQRQLVENLVLPVILMPYGVDPQPANDTANADFLKGLLGTPRRDRLVDEKIARLTNSQTGGGASTRNVADLLSPIQPGLAFFEMLDQYRRIADAVDALCKDFSKPFSDADRVLRWALIGWVDRFLPMKLIDKSAEEIKRALGKDLDFLAYRQAVHRFLKLLSRQKYGERVLGVYDQVRFVRVCDLMGVGSITESLFLLPHRTVSPAACLQEFNRRTSPECIMKKIWQSDKREAYRTAYEALDVIADAR